MQPATIVITEPEEVHLRLEALGLRSDLLDEVRLAWAAAASSFTPSGTWEHFGLWMGIFVALCVGASMYDVAAQDEAAG